MLIEIQIRKCPFCCNVFEHWLGGVVLIPDPECPQCGCRPTKIIDRESIRN